MRPLWTISNASTHSVVTRFETAILMDSPSLRFSCCSPSECNMLTLSIIAHLSSPPNHFLRSRRYDGCCHPKPPLTQQGQSALGCFRWMPEGSHSGFCLVMGCSLVLSCCGWCLRYLRGSILVLLTKAHMSIIHLSICSLVYLKGLSLLLWYLLSQIYSSATSSIYLLLLLGQHPSKFFTFSCFIDMYIAVPHRLSVASTPCSTLSPLVLEFFNCILYFSNILINDDSFLMNHCLMIQIAGFLFVGNRTSVIQRQHCHYLHFLQFRCCVISYFYFRLHCQPIKTWMLPLLTLLVPLHWFHPPPSPTSFYDSMPCIYFERVQHLASWTH